MVTARAGTVLRRQVVLLHRPSIFSLESPHMGYVVADVDRAKAVQQPEWENPSQVGQVRALLASCAPLVNVADVDALRSHLARVATSAAHVLQAGDCAEDPIECSAKHVQGKIVLLDLLAAGLHSYTGRPVLRVGRIAGQFAKPRSTPVERVGDVELPVYRGHMVNSPEPEAVSRRPDPLRLLTGYMAANEIMQRLGWHGLTARPHGSTIRSSGPATRPCCWTTSCR